MGLRSHLIYKLVYKPLRKTTKEELTLIFIDSGMDYTQAIDEMTKEPCIHLLAHTQQLCTCTTHAHTYLMCFSYRLIPELQCAH